MNEITITSNGKTQIFQGKEYHLRESQGYFYKFTKGTTSLLHRIVWISHYGEIKKGYEIHHINGDKNNNEIENLQCLSIRQHKEHHKNNMSDELKEKYRKNLTENVRPKANEWHGSTAGREWHRQQYETMKDKLHETAEYTCKWCGKKYITKKIAKNMFCSANCRNKDRYNRGVDNIKIICPVCNNEFETNKYKKQITCSRECGSIHRKQTLANK